MLGFPDSVSGKALNNISQSTAVEESASKDRIMLGVNKVVIKSHV